EKQTREIPATGHVWPEEWTVVTPTDCTTTGVEERVCENNCGEKQTREIPATGHDWPEEWTVITPAGCTSTGEEQRECKNGCGEKQIREIQATGHDWSDWTVSKKATCTAEGEETRICNNCKITETRPIAKLEHSLGDWTTTKDATCSDDGERSKFCSECGEAVVTEKIPATGIHTAGDWEISKEADCDEDGERIKRCTSGGEILEREVIPATGHAYVTTEKEAVDCHTPYIKEVICSKCGDVKEKSVNYIKYPPLKNNAEDVAFLSGVLVVKIEKMTVKTFKENFYCDVTIFDNSGKELSDADYVGTNGTLVCGVCGKSFTIAVIGDINGDGVVDTIDYMMIKRYKLGTYELSGAPLAAADVNVDLSADAIDYMMVKMYVLDKYDFYKNVPDWDEVSKLIIDVK
ncbi:MAG: hypothetical protein IJB88_01160, partial [Clostridia bacterium]|nr:hypothetical protein [Clostridia bacterium]